MIRRLALACLALLSGLAACRGPEEGQAEPFDSARLVILMGGMRMLEGKPSINVALKNKTDAPLWVAAAFDAPEEGQDCAFFERIEPGAHHTFVCVQDDLIFDVTYDVHFEVFAGEDRTELLEQQSTDFVFGAQFRELLKAVGRAQARDSGRTEP